MLVGECQKHLSLCVRKPTIWVPTRYDTNRVVQVRSVISIHMRDSEINRQLFLFLNNRHWQEMDNWMNLFI